MRSRRTIALALALLCAPFVWSGCVDPFECRGGPTRCEGSEDRLPVIRNAAVEAVMNRYDDAIWGYYLREIDGPELARYNANLAFEPASALKALYLAHALHQGDLKAAMGQGSLGEFLDQPISGTLGEIGSCPLGGDTFPPEPLQSSLELMMRDSDNARTHAIGLRFGYAEIEATGVADLDMVQTEMNHVIGCPVPPNRTTLEDLGQLYEGMTNGFLSHEAWTIAHRVMKHSPEHFIDPPGNAAQDAQFMNDVELVWKGGHYEITPFFYVTKAGWLTLPWRVNGQLRLRQYVFGVFVNETLNSDDAIREAVSALLSETVARAYSSWPDGS